MMKWPSLNDSKNKSTERMSADDLTELREAIDEDYEIEMYIDELPVIFPMGFKKIAEGSTKAQY